MIELSCGVDVMKTLDDLVISYNSNLLKVRNNIFVLNKIGFDLDDEQDKLEKIESDVSKRIFLLEDNDDEKINVYNEAIEEMEKIELSNYNYYKFYNDCEDIIRKLRYVDLNNINELCSQVLSLIEAIRDGLIIVSDKDRYLLEKVFKTIYEVLKVSFLYGKGKELVEEINKIDMLKEYINKYINEDVKEIKNSNTSEELKNSVSVTNQKGDIDSNLIATIGIIQSTKIRDKNKADIIKDLDLDKKEILIDEEYVLELQNKEEKKDNKIKKIVDIGLIAGAGLLYGATKIDKSESNELVKGDEMIIPINNDDLINDADDYFFEENYVDSVDGVEELSFFYDEDTIEEFDQEIKNSDILDGKVPEKLKKEYNENQEFISNWSSLFQMIMAGGKFIGKAMMYALLGREKGKAMMKFIKANGITKDNYKQKKLELEEENKRIR